MRPSAPEKSFAGATTIGRDSCPDIRPNVGGTIRAHSRPRFSGKLRRPPCAVPPSFRRAPQHIIDTDMWGVSDPAERPRGRGCEARAGSLTPHFCSDSCAGALSGRHKTPPDIGDNDRAMLLLFNDFNQRSRQRVVSRNEVQIGRQASVEGANRALTLRPPPRPLYLNGLTIWRPSKSSKPGKSSE